MYFQDKIPVMKNILFLPAIAILLFSCSEKQEKLTKEEAMDVARKIDSCISRKRPNYYNDLFDIPGMARKIAKLADTKVSNSMLSGLRTGLQNARLGDKIIQSLGDGGHYQLVKYYEKDNTHHLLFRLYSSDGMNYHDLELSKRNGKAGIADMYIYMSGEDLSKTLTSLALSFAENSGKSASKMDQLTESVTRIRKKLMSNDYNQAMTYYNTLPEDIKDQRTIQLIYLQICKGLSDELYLKAMNDFQTRYPDDPNMNLIMIDAHIMEKEYGKALIDVDRLDDFIDKDPFLDFYRAMINNLAEQPEEARKHLEKLNKSNPEFETGVLELIANYITAGLNEKAKELIKVYEMNEKFNQVNLRNYLFTQPQFSKD